MCCREWAAAARSHSPARSGSRSRPRPGFTAIEVVAALAIGGVLLAGLAGAVISVSRLERSAADRAERMAARILAGVVLSHEMRALDTRSDGFSFGQDSATLRAFRGVAVVCGADSASADVRYRGLRAPDVTKDSLLVLRGAGPERALPLSGTGAVAASCVPAPGEVALALRPGAGLVAGDIVLVFERGDYHLGSGALRYRRGAGGRQPLTAGAFLDDSTGFDLLVHPGAAGAQPETVAVRFDAMTAAPAAAMTGIRTRIHVPFLNAPVPLDSVPGP